MKPLLRKDAAFGFHTDLHAHEKDTVLWADVTEEMVAHFLEVVKPDYVQFDCKGHYGFASYPTKVGYPSPGIRKDALGIWRKVTKKLGVALFIHYSGVWDQEAIVHHPEWAAKHADGTNDRLATSLFSPYMDEMLIPQLKEVISEYDIDGIWVDGDCWGTIADYSEKAIEEFTKSTGITDIPKSSEDAYWKEFISFHREQFKHYVRKYADILHDFKPGLQITSNWMFTTFMPEAVSVPLDYLSGDYGGNDTMNIARLEARYLSSVGVPWDLMAWGANRGPNQRNWSWKTAIQLKHEASVIVSQGGCWQVVYQGTRSGYLDDGISNTLAEVGKFIRDRQSLCHKSSTVPQVALLLSESSIYDKHVGVFTDPGVDKRPILGPLHALLELQYSVDVKAEHQLVGHMDDYPVIVVPNWHLLTESLVKELREYVRNGGNLFLTGPQVASHFQDELGVRYDGPVTDMTAIYAELEKNLDNPFLMFLHPDFTEINLESDGIFSDCGGLFQTVEVIGAEVVSHCFPARNVHKDAMVASTVNKYGKGTIAATYVDLGESFIESHAPVIRNEYKKVMTRLFPSPKVEVICPHVVDVALRQKDGKLQVHLVNTSGMQTSPIYAIIDYIPEVHNIKLRIRLDSKPKSVEWAYGGETESMQYENGILSLELKKLEIHDVLVIE